MGKKAKPVPAGHSYSRPHQPSHQNEPRGAVVKRIMAIAEAVQSLLGPDVGARVVHKGLVVEIRHLVLLLVGQLRDIGIGGGESGGGRAVSQALIHTAVENGGARDIG